MGSRFVEEVQLRGSVKDVDCMGGMEREKRNACVFVRGGGTFDGICGSERGKSARDSVHTT